jgi:hypothetical protein
MSPESFLPLLAGLSAFAEGTGSLDFQISVRLPQDGTSIQADDMPEPELGIPAWAYYASQGVPLPLDINGTLVWAYGTPEGGDPANPIGMWVPPSTEAAPDLSTPQA